MTTGMPSRIASTGLAALVALLATAGTTRAQDDPPSVQFIERVDVSVVNVEVFVTDRDGQPVEDLTVEDFVLLKDGDPVDISNFYAATRPNRLEENVAALERGAPPRPEAAAFLPADRQLNLVAYVDHSNLRPNNRKRVLDDLRGFLTERAAQGDNVMLVGYNGSVDVVQPFTRDETRIRRGLDRLGKVATRRQIDDLERRTILGRIASAADDTLNRDPLSRPIDGTATAYSAVRSYVEERRSELRQTAKALKDTLQTISGLPGRKALLYVSDGLPARPGEELYQAMADLFAGQQTGEPIFDPMVEALRDDQSQLFNDIIRTANAEQVTFYPIDGRGPSGENRTSSEFGNQTVSNAGNTVLAAVAEANFQEPLIAMAEGTGGESIFNTFAFGDALTSTSRGFDSFYSLGFILPQGGEGEYHDLDVIVRHPDYKVRHRSGFQDKNETDRMADRTRSSLFLDTTDNPLGIAVAFGEAKRKKGEYVLPVLVRIPFRELTLLPRGAKREGRLQIFVAVRDEQGRVASLHQQPYPLDLTAEQAAQAVEQDIGYGREFALRPGTATFAVGVWDEVSGTKSFIQERVLIGNRRIDGGGRGGRGGQ